MKHLLYCTAIAIAISLIGMGCEQKTAPPAPEPKAVEPAAAPAPMPEAAAEPTPAAPVPETEPEGLLMPITDPGFEDPLKQGPNKFGHVFTAWTGWIWAKPSEMRVSRLAHSGETSGLIICDDKGCARFYEEEREVEPGRYRFTFFIRGLDILPAQYDENVSLHFWDLKWFQNLPEFAGTYGWRKVTYVAEMAKQHKARIYLGLKSPGMVWFDDVKVEKVGPEVALTDKPQLGPEEAPIAMPGAIDEDTAMRCALCGYKNMPAWKNCYACGIALEGAGSKLLPPKLLASFEEGTSAPFSEGEGGEAVAEHATEGGKAYKWTASYISWDGPQDWTGYDFLKADLFVTGGEPIGLYIEVRDRETKGYWTRVNHSTTLMPGENTISFPCAQFVGEKSRPGRLLIQDGITRFVLSLKSKGTPVYLDNVRLECDTSDNARFKGLHAFDFGLPGSPLLRGMTRITAGTAYTRGRGFGLKDAKVWRSFDVLQPDIVYRDFVCIESGGFALDVPNGKYHVFANTDCPGGFWGELPKYRQRSIVAEGQTVFEEQMDREKAIAKYFRFADKDDLYTENTFDKYLGAIFGEKEFDIEVTDGQLNIEFNGPNWTNCVSCIVVFPKARMTEGKKYLASLRERRRFDFNNYFRRLLHYDNKPEPALAAAQQQKGYCIFSRDYMQDVYPNTKPTAEELTDTVSAFATAGEIEPLTFTVRSYRDLGMVRVIPSDLKGPATIPAAAVKVGYVSNRLKRKAMDGTLYTIQPRYVMKTSEVALTKESSRRFWTNVKVPAGTPPGTYAGQMKLAFADGTTDAVKVKLAVLSSAPLPEADLPVGPWGLEIRVPWFNEEMDAYNAAMDTKCIALMREYGCTSFSSGLNIGIRGKGQNLSLDFTHADRIMRTAKAAGMQAFVNYGRAFNGLNVYGYPKAQDPKAHGFNDLGELFKHVFKLMNTHAEQAGWIPLFITACDEPIGDNLTKCAANAALLKACSTPRIRFAGATSMTKKQDDMSGDPHLPLVRSLDIANYNGHDTWSIEEANRTGSWAFYNGGNRWTYGFYMFMLRQKYNMAFRLSWHWNANAGDPYYALDCREDDYSWANADANGDLITSLQFERLREGIDDYRYLLKLKKLVAGKPTHPSAAAARQALDRVLALVPKDDRGTNSIGDSATGKKGLQEARREVAELIKTME